jgi:hypothetical protein
MPKNRHLTFSDHQSQSAHNAKIRKMQELLKKSSPVEQAPETETSSAPPAKKKTAKKKKAGAEL